MKTLPHLLCIDDDNKIRELLKKYLTSKGFRVTSSKNAFEAEKFISFFLFDLIILDIMMPKKSGIDFLDELRKFDSNTPVLMLTADSELERKKDSFNIGCDDYLVKPFSFIELLARINALLRRSSSIDGNEIQLGELLVDPQKRKVIYFDKTLDLTKKEFDLLRSQKKAHSIFKKYNLNFIPYQHEKLDHWRNSLTGGISYLDKDTNLQIHGGVDDIWYDLDNKQLVMVDYKAQSSNTKVETDAYLESIYHQGYKIQMDIYVHILRKMGFNVSDTSYFYVCNAEKGFDNFEGKLNFTITLVPYVTDTSWVENNIKEMKKTLELDSVPEINKSCEKCMYLDAGKGFI